MDVLEQNPYERMLSSGVRASTLLDLVSVGFSRSEEDARAGTQLAQGVIRLMSNATNLQDLGADEVAKAAGLDRFETYRILALIEIGRRSANSKRGELEELSLPEQVAERLSYLKSERKEHFVVVLLDAKLKIQRIATVHMGTVSSSIVGVREIFREAVRDGASSVIVAHNHPSGDPTPSPEDIEVTKKIVEAGQLMDIPLVDHIVLGYDRFTSFARLGML